MQDVVPEDDTKEEIMENIQKGNFTMKILKDQLLNIMKMGPVSQVMNMIPGFNGLGVSCQRTSLRPYVACYLTTSTLLLTDCTMAISRCCGGGAKCFTCALLHVWGVDDCLPHLSSWFLHYIQNVSLALLVCVCLLQNRVRNRHCKPISCSHVPPIVW